MRRCAGSGAGRAVAGGPAQEPDLRGLEGVWRNILSSAQPILASKVRDVGEFVFVIGDDGVTEGSHRCRQKEREQDVGTSDRSRTHGLTPFQEVVPAEAGRSS